MLKNLCLKVAGVGDAVDIYLLHSDIVDELESNSKTKGLKFHDRRSGEYIAKTFS